MPPNSKIQHVIVLMLENRSFDHLMGFAQHPDVRYDGLKGTEFNYVLPTDPSSEKVVVSDDAPYVPDLDPSPGHEVADVHVQLYASDPAHDTNQGFVYNYGQQKGVTAEKARGVMRCFSPHLLPVISTLAKEFAVCDHWFSSLPGPTWPNRLFAHCATSGGFADNNSRHYGMTTIFERLSDVQLDSWRIYFHPPDLPQSAMLANLRSLRYLKFFADVKAFFRDCADGTLPWYSFIEPRYFSVGGAAANDQHPDHGILLGEKLIADVYNAVRSSPQWNESLLLIVWDEHGGFYDHVVPPAAVNPDGKTAPNCDFKQLGVRVPAVVVSPWIPAATIDQRVHDHTSIAATLKEVFGTKSFLTLRDAAASRFDDLCSLNTPRGDAPARMEAPHASLIDTIHAAVHSGAAQMRAPSELQQSLVGLANEIEPITHLPLSSVTTEAQAALRVHSAARFLFTT